MSAPAALTAPDAFALQTVGPQLCGWIVLIYIYGSCVPSFFWHSFSRKAGHSRILRSAIMCVFCLNTVLAALAGYNIFRLGTLQQRDAVTLRTPSLPSGAVSLLVGLLALIVQTYFAQRAYRACNRRVIFIVILVPLLLAGLVTATMRSAYTFLTNQGQDIAYQRAVAGLAWLCVTAAADAMISLALTVALWRSRTGCKTPTDGILTKLIQMACQTAALTTIAAIGVIVLSLTLQYTDWRNLYFVILHPMPSIYTISFVWCLDSLENLRHLAAWQKGMFGVTGSGIAPTQICTACGQWLPLGNAKHTAKINEHSHETQKETDDLEKASHGTECTEPAQDRQELSHTLLGLCDALQSRALSPAQSRASENENRAQLVTRRASLFRPSEATLR